MIHIMLLDCTVSCKTEGIQGDLCGHGFYGLAACLNQLLLQILLTIAKYVLIGSTSCIVLK